ncbi:hypothetical protein [Flaviaesturariibacter amylovorans]|uniref:Uncharacterized protein n=1 Tax=Flaviaesturariibacter amylovorans TaxID=1084520 RepID=A0ABP8H4P1_9BACT
MTKKVTTLAQYLELSEQEKLQLLHQDAVFVGKRIVSGQNAILFQLYGFYVEVVYQSYRREIASLTASDSADFLQPYIGQIFVRGLDHDKAEEGE